MGLYFIRVNPLKLNPATGFLESINPSTAECFTSEKKLKFIELGMQYANRRELPDITAICDAVGIAHRTWLSHLQVDEKLRELWNEVKSKVFSGMCNELSVKAKSKNGIIANIAVLRYLESGTFNPESRVIHTSDNAAIKGVGERISGYFDAEIVDKPKESGDNQPKLAGG